MRKRTMKRSNKKKPACHTVAFYVKTFLFSVVVGISVFLGSSYFFSSRLTCANSRTCTSDLSLNINNTAVGIFQGRAVTPPKIDLSLDFLTSKSSVLGTNSTLGEKHIYVNLATQTLYAYQGETEIMNTLISSGKWGRTPVGNFHIWTKLRATRMSGGSGTDAYDLPNVPYVMYFYRDFGLHGAYWHNNFGHPMSHGCVNMRSIDAQELFNWVDGPTPGQLGTAISVCNTFEAPNICVQEKPIN